MQEYPKNREYLVTRDGKVYSKNYNHTGKKKELRTFSNNKGYVWVPLYDKKSKRDKSVYVHRIVAETYLPNEMGKPEVNHIDGNPKNNSLENLEWVTRSENEKHKYQILEYKQKKCKRVLCVETGELFESLHDAERAKNVLSQNIWKTIKGERHTCGGFHWRAI